MFLLFYIRLLHPTRCYEFYYLKSGHVLYRCSEYVKLNPQGRHNLATELERCSNCLGIRHQAKLVDPHITAIVVRRDTKAHCVLNVIALKLKLKQ